MPLPTDDLIIWASSDVNLPNLAGPNKVKPIDDLILKGWDFKQKPAADEFNYILNNMGKWINWAITDIEAGTSLNTPNTLVRRDGSGNFSAGTITAALTGNSSTATTLQNSRTINGTSFNGSADITTNSWGYSRNIAFTGFATGNGDVDGSGNVSIALSMGSGFSTSQASSGYTYLPNGIIFQWGTFSLGTATLAKQIITLPLTFPVAGVLAIASPSYASGGATDQIGASITSTSIISLTKGSADTSARTGTWFAIGY